MTEQRCRCCPEAGGLWAYHETVMERAAILEYDGGHDRFMAGVRARAEMEPLAGAFVARAMGAPPGEPPPSIWG